MTTEQEYGHAEGIADVRDVRTSNLRPHHSRALEAIDRATTAGQSKMRVVLATGTGKSVVIAYTIAKFLKSGRARRPLYLTPARTMAEQMVAVLNSLDVGDDGPLGDTHPIVLLEHEAVHGDRDGAITIATLPRFRSLARAAEAPDFDLIILDGFDGGRDWPASATARSIGRFHATVIAFATSPGTGHEAPGPTVFAYTLRDALVDGVLVDTSRQAATDSGSEWPPFDPQVLAQSQRHVFLSGVYEDRNALQKVANDLEEAGIRVAGIVKGVPPDAGRGDVVVSVLSPNSTQSPLVDDHVSRLLERRGVDVVPAVAEYCAVPAPLAGRFPVDITTGTDGLLRRLQASAMVEFGKLDPGRFEQLVSELLIRLGFTLNRSADMHADRGFDFAAVFQDAEGFGMPTQYLIQLKLIKSSYRDTSELIRLIRESGQPLRGMVITSGHLTSITEKSLASAQDEGIDVHVIDGPRLRSLLLRYPDLVVKHFASKVRK